MKKQILLILIWIVTSTSKPAEQKSFRERLFGPRTPSSEPGASRSLRERFGFGRKETTTPSALEGQSTMHDIERKLDEITKSFEQKVREAKKNLMSSSLGRIKFNDAELKRVLSNIKQAQLSQAEKQKLLGKIKRLETLLTDLTQDIHVVSQGATKSKGEYAEALKDKYIANFSKPEITKFNIHSKAVYDFLGIGNQRGPSLSAAAIRDPIENKLIQLTVSGRYTADDIKNLRRQLNYIFNNDVTKRQYDAYLQDKLKLVDPKQKERLNSLRNAIDDLKLNILYDLKQAIAK